MNKPYIPLLVFSILLLLVVPVSFDFLVSTTPGWHTTILPPFFIWGVAVVVVLLFVILGFWLSYQRTDSTNRILFVLHLVLTIPTVLYLKSPAIFLNVPITNAEEMMKAIDFRLKLMLVAWALFIGGQMLFLVYYFRTVLLKKGRPVA